MARTATYEKRKIDEAIRLVESAKTVQQLRQGQAILIPALAGASMEDTARIKYWAQPGLRHAADVPGVRRNHLLRQGSSGRASSSTPEPGGRESVSGSLAFRSQERKGSARYFPSCGLCGAGRKEIFPLDRLSASGSSWMTEAHS